MILLSLISTLLAFFSFLNNFTLLPSAQVTITESVRLTDTMPGMANGQQMGQESVDARLMPNPMEGNMMAGAGQTNPMSANLPVLMNHMNEMMLVMNQMTGAMQVMTNTMTTDASMNGMAGSMSTDMATTMKNMNEMMMMCMADMMKSNKKWYWIGGGALALILLGVLGWWLWRNRARFTPNHSPLLILQRRLAQGEITLEQYEAVRMHLSTATAGEHI